MRDICLSSEYYSPSVFTHSNNVEEIAVSLAKRLGGHIEICAISGQTHDIGAIIFGRNGKNGEGHHITGSREVKKILSDLYPEWFIKRVQYCIEVHRGSLDVARETVEAQIVATADAIDHINNINSKKGGICELWRVGREDVGMDADKTYEWLSKKLDNDKRKIMAQVWPEMEPLYNRAQVALGRIYLAEPVYR